MDQQAATVGNGTMIALRVADSATVQAIHAKVLALGGSNEGEPGVRQAHYFCGYVRDLDGNKLNFYCHLDQ